MTDSNLNSSPPTVRISPSSPGPLSPTPTRQRRSTFDQGIVEDIFDYRKDQYAISFPSYSSSPIKLQRRYREEQNRKVDQRRTAHRDNNAKKRRGGNEEMERFVMNSEREKELQSLKLQAEEHAIPMDEVERLEKEEQEEKDDDELLDYVAEREHIGKELDQMLADLLIT